MSPKQGILFEAFRRRNSMTLDECAPLVGRDIHSNANKHVGEIIKRMIARGLIQRVSPGLYELVPGPATPKPAKVDESEIMPAMREWARKNGITK